MTATVLNSSNTVVKTLLKAMSPSQEVGIYPTWDGTNTAGNVVADGSYTIKVVATNDAGSSGNCHLSSAKWRAAHPAKAHDPDRRGLPVGYGRVRLHPQHVLHRHLPHL